MRTAPGRGVRTYVLYWGQRTPPGERQRLRSTCWSDWPCLGEGVPALLGLPEFPTTCGSPGPGQGANAWPFREQCSGAKGLLRGPPLQP